MKTNVKCETVEPLLTAYHLDELEEADAVVVCGHLAVCVPCSAASREIEATLGVVREALAAPAEGALRLEDRRREAALNAQRRTWAMKVRELLDLPGTGVVPLELWPGALARAAIIFILPLTLATALLVTGLRVAEHRMAALPQRVNPGTEPFQPSDDPPAYEVDLLVPPQLADRDILLPPDTGEVYTARSPGVFHADSLARGEWLDPDLLGIGLPEQPDATHLVNTAATLKAEMMRRTAQTDLAAQQRKMAGHIKSGTHSQTNRERIFSTPKK